MQTSKENEKWTLFGLYVPMLFSSKENAELVKQFIVDKSHPSVKERLRKTIFVGRLYEDANVAKIKTGAVPYIVEMERDGTVLRCASSLGGYGLSGAGILGKFGFTDGKITSVCREASTDSNLNTLKLDKIITFKCLAKSAEEAREKADAYRIKTLLDDIWFKDHDNNLL